MAIITAHKFDGDGTIREFQVGDSILSKSHCRVWVDNVEPDSSTWDLLGSTILFDTAPPVGLAENVKIYVSNDGTFPNEYTSPSATETVETNIADVITVANNIAYLLSLAASLPNDFATINTAQEFTNKTLDSITNIIGADHIHYKVRNESGGTLLKGTVVTAHGTQPSTDYLEVTALTDPATQVALGILHTDIANNSTGLCTNTGVCDDFVNTSAWAVGTILYPNNSGGFTNVQPTTGFYQACAIVTRSHVSQGTLLVEFSEPTQFGTTTNAGILQLVDVLTSTDATKALTAAQGKVLKDLVDAKVGNDSVQALHATDALSVVANVLYLNKADGTNENIDLSVYLDDTNLSKIISGTYVVDEPLAGDKNLKFVRDDASVFYIDASMFFDDSNLVLSVDGNTGAVDLSSVYEPYIDKAIQAEDNAIDFSTKKNFELTATAANITALGLTGTFPREGTILIHTAENITGWGAEFKFKTVPTDLTGDETFGYFIEDATNIWIGRVQ